MTIEDIMSIEEETTDGKRSKTYIEKTSWQTHEKMARKLDLHIPRVIICRTNIITVLSEEEIVFITCTIPYAK